MPKKIDLTGQKFRRLTVLREAISYNSTGSIHARSMPVQTLVRFALKPNVRIYVNGRPLPKQQTYFGVSIKNDQVNRVLGVRIGYGNPAQPSWHYVEVNFSDIRYLGCQFVHGTSPEAALVHALQQTTPALPSRYRRVYNVVLT